MRAVLGGVSRNLRGSRVKKPLVGIVMGSQSDWDVMQHAVNTMKQFGVPCEAKVVSAHRTPDLLAEFGVALAGVGISIEVVLGGAHRAHLEGEARFPRLDEYIDVVAELHDAARLALDLVEGATGGRGAAGGEHR